MSEYYQAITNLYVALHNRIYCPSCNGRGIQWVEDEDGNVDVRPCECEVEARQMLEQYRDLKVES